VQKKVDLIQDKYDKMKAMVAQGKSLDEIKTLMALLDRYNFIVGYNFRVSRGREIQPIALLYRTLATDHAGMFSPLVLAAQSIIDTHGEGK